MTEASPASPAVPESRRPMSRGCLAALVALCLLAAGLYRLYWTPYAIDDPWITYRYAENLAEGRGFVFNPGERVCGTSTPLYTLILAAAHLGGLPVPATSWTLSFLAMIGTVVATFLVVRRVAGDRAAIVAGSLLVTMQVFHRVATYGMETPVYVLLIVCAFLAYVHERIGLAALLAGLCLVLRLDGGAVGVSLFAAELLRRRQVPWRALLVFLAVSLPWFVFAQIYFGSVFPSSMLAKRMHTNAEIMKWLPQWLLLQPALAVAVFGWIKLLATRESRRLGVPLAIWGSVYATAFTLGGVEGYDWYLTPLAALVAIGAGTGIAAMVDILEEPWPLRWAALLGLCAVAVYPDAHRIKERYRGEEGIRGSEALRLEAALWMRDNLPPGATICTGGVGHIGYFSNRPVLDAMGLVSPQVLRDQGAGHDVTDGSVPRFLPGIVRVERPEFIFDGFWLGKGEAVPSFMKGTYTVMREWVGADPLWPRFILMRRLPD